VFLGVFLPLRALVIHRVLQTVPAFVIGGVKACGLAPRAPVLVQVLESWQVSMKGCGRARVRVPRAPVLVQVLESWQVSMKGCGRSRVYTPSKVVLPRPLQQSYTPPGSSVVTYLQTPVRRVRTKKSDDSLVGHSQSFVVVQQVYDERIPRPRIHVRERVQVEPERVRRGRLGGVPPYSAHPSEAVAGLDALHVGEDHGRDIQVRIEGGTDLIELTFVVLGRHVEAVRGRK